MACCHDVGRVALQALRVSFGGMAALSRCGSCSTCWCTHERGCTHVACCMLPFGWSADLDTLVLPALMP
eukprot:13289697-Alexandrium_andersonii.AAC.1